MFGLIPSHPFIRKENPMRLATILMLLFVVLAAASAQAQYGVEFTAPDTFKTVRQDSTAIFHVHIRNSGSVQDTFRISLPRRNMPANWIPLFCDSFVCYDPPFNILLNAGESFPDDPHVSIIAWQDPGTGWVECQVRSLGDTTLHREIRFWCRNDVGVEGGPEASRPGVDRYLPAPNPFSSYARIPGHERESFVLYDVSGRKVGLFPGCRIGEDLAPGVYFLNPIGRPAKLMRILKIR